MVGQDADAVAGFERRVAHTLTVACSSESRSIDNAASMAEPSAVSTAPYPGLAGA